MTSASKYLVREVAKRLVAAVLGDLLYIVDTASVKILHDWHLASGLGHLLLRRLIDPTDRPDLRPDQSAFTTFVRRGYGLDNYLRGVPLHRLTAPVEEVLDASASTLAVGSVTSSRSKCHRAVVVAARTRYRILRSRCEGCDLNAT